MSIINLAISNYQKALEINSNLASVQLMLGNVFSLIGEFEQAIYCYQNYYKLSQRMLKLILS